MFRWLSYGHDPKLAGKKAGVNKDFFKKREFSFTIANDIYIRYLCFADETEMRREIQLKQPHKIDIGAIYSHPPKVLYFFSLSLSLPLTISLSLSLLFSSLLFSSL